MTDILDIAVPDTGIYRFGSSFDKATCSIPGFYISKGFTGDDASMRTKWRAIVFHGVGTLTANVYIDDVLKLSQKVTMTENFQQQRVINLPRGRSTGYIMRYEYQIESGHVRFVEIFYDALGSDVN